MASGEWRVAVSSPLESPPSRPPSGSDRCTTEKQVPPADEYRPVECIAHRGFAAVEPENTVGAVRRAASAGADAVEVDVRRCGSGEVVVCHDPTVDRVTDGSGAVAHLDCAALAALDVLGSGEGIPTLERVVAALPDGVGLNVELKERGIAADVVADLAGLEDWWLSSFDPGALAAARRAGVNAGSSTGPTSRSASASASDPDAVPTALLVDADVEDPIARAVDLGCSAVHPHVDRCTPGFVAAAHEAGLAINAWTVRSERTARRVADAGVDGLIADAPAWCHRGSASDVGQEWSVD